MKIRKFNTALKRINYLELAVYYIGQAQLDQAWHGKSSALPVNRLYFAGSGEAFIGIDGKYEALEPGFVYLVPVGTPMDFYCDGNMEKIYVHFNLFRPDHYDSLDGLNQIYRIPFSAQEYENLQLHAARGNFADTLIVKDVLYQTLAQFQEYYSIIDEHVPIYSKSVMNTIAYVQENLSANLHLEDLAKHAYVEMLISIASFFSVPTDYLLELDHRSYLETTGLSSEQLAHVQQIINDIITAKK